MNESERLHRRALNVMPGGVNSPVRAFGAVGGIPISIASGAGSKMTTVDQQELVDFCCSWGALILGHARPEVVAAVQRTAAQGTSFGLNTRGEVELGELLGEQVPGLERVRLVSSGTEACMTALRLARGHTGRDTLLKFDGCYHGHADSLLVSAGSGLLTSGLASSDGVPKRVAQDTLVVPYNDLEAFRDVMAARGDDIAAVIVEPVAANMGFVKPASGFLEGLRELTSKHGSLLIFDEVITGFRLGPSTYGKRCGVVPDLTCLGKIIGGGLPIGAVGGRGDIMSGLAPCGTIYQAGTLSGNPLSVAAGLATLRILLTERPYAQLARKGAHVVTALNEMASHANLPLCCSGLGGMFTVFFTGDDVTNLEQAKRCNTETYAGFFHALLDRGVYVPPSQFEVNFISSAHDDSDIDRFLDAARAWMDTMGEGS